MRAVNAPGELLKKSSPTYAEATVVTPSKAWCIIWELVERIAEAERAEAELAALKARRCEGCKHVDKNGYPWGCRADMLLFPKQAECCNRWAERTTP